MSSTRRKQSKMREALFEISPELRKAILDAPEIRITHRKCGLDVVGMGDHARCDACVVLIFTLDELIVTFDGKEMDLIDLS